MVKAAIRPDAAREAWSRTAMPATAASALARWESPLKGSLRYARIPLSGSGFTDTRSHFRPLMSRARPAWGRLPG